MDIVVALLAATVVVMGAVLILNHRGQRNHQLISDTVKAEFKVASQEALSDASAQFLNLANERFTRQAEAGTRDLDSKKQLIDQQLNAMKGELGRVSTLVQTIEKDRAAKFGELTTHLKIISEQTVSLTASTTTLREALSSSRARGQWGERMAEDILRLIGFVEGINYLKQATIEGVGSRPDFVFLLPGELRLNMDVKFPLDNYVRFLGVDTDPERDQHKAAFLRDVRGRIKEITSREYIDPERGTVDYVLLFIPNESVYSFIHESDQSILETALKSRVIICSPVTLFAVLAIVRQAVENFALQKASEEIIGLFGRFNAEWGKFKDGLETLGKRIKSTQTAYDEVVGPRKRMLERPLGRIEDLRQQRGIPLSLSDSDVVLGQDDAKSADPDAAAENEEVDE